MHKLSLTSESPIFELELLPVLIAQMAWLEWIQDAQVVYFLDNESARHSLIKTSGGEHVANAIIEECINLENAAQLKTWFARVPTHSNLADPPNRGEVHALIAAGCSRVTVQWDVVLSRIL